MKDVNSKIENFKEKCREINLALTVQRIAVYAYLAGTAVHPSADRVYEEIHKEFPTISRTSVYRILETFARNGLIMKLVHPGTAVRYDGNPVRHHHLVCMECENIFDIESSEKVPDIKMDPPRFVGDFEVCDYSIVFTGMCAKCREKNDKRIPEKGKS
ncbi:MAG: Fur family transcriptional regulator [Planctomycetia bacterium]|nr:Fur family transcriptional regulator [Planctomycetia bacterium]